MTLKDRIAVAFLAIALGVVAAGILVPSPRAVPLVTLGPRNADVAYREGVLGRPSSITPLTARTQVDRDLVALLFRGLMRLGPDGELLPDVAESWTISSDGKVYRFVLRDDGFWHDGAPITSRDVAFTVGLLQDAAYNGPLSDAWSGVQVVQESKHVVRFELGLPRASFLSLTTLPLLPEHILLGTPVAELADSDFSQNPLGNGAFRIAALDANHALLERVRSIDPMQPPFGTPIPTQSPPVAPRQYDTLSDIDLRFFDNPGAMLGELKAGRLEAVGGLSGANLQVAAGLKNVRLVTYPRATLTAVILNLMPQHKEFRNADVRSGLLAAIDRDALVTDVLGGHGVRADIALPSSSWAFDSTAVTPVHYSRATAETSLTKGGWQRVAGGFAVDQSGKPNTIHLVAPGESTNKVANAAAKQVAAGWQALGLAVEVEDLGPQAYLEAIRSRTFDAAIVDVDLGLDPDLSPLFSSNDVTTGGSNLSGFQSPDLDKLLVAAASKVSAEDRKAAMAAVERYLAANTPILPLYFRDYVFAVSNRIENVSPRFIADASSRYWDVIDWRLASDR